jgi:gluconokinase
MDCDAFSGETMTRVLLLMGVSGSGKSTIGRALAERLACPFFDGDDFHPPENVTKMSSGEPLTDDDRWPWLDRLARLISEQLSMEETAVIACSALKKNYRVRLRENNDALVFIYLRGSFASIWERLRQRENHYMKPELLRSQFAILEEPDEGEALLVDIRDDTDKIVSDLIESLDWETT